MRMMDFSFKENQVVRIVHVYIIPPVKLSLVSIQSRPIVVIVDQVIPVDIVKSVRHRHFPNFLLFFLQYKRSSFPVNEHRAFTVDVPNRISSLKSVYVMMVGLESIVQKEFHYFTQPN